MKKRLFLVIVLVMLAALLPAPTTAAPQTARQSFLNVGSWNLNENLGAGYIKFAAEDVNWQFQKGDVLYFGYIYDNGSLLTVDVEVVVMLSPQTYTFPQHLDLEGVYEHYLTPSADCSLTQFVRILPNGGSVPLEVTNGPYEYCVTVAPYP